MVDEIHLYEILVKMYVAVAAAAAGVGTGGGMGAKGTQRGCGLRVWVWEEGLREHVK